MNQCRARMWLLYAPVVGTAMSQRGAHPLCTAAPKVGASNDSAYAAHKSRDALRTVVNTSPILGDGIDANNRNCYE